MTTHVRVTNWLHCKATLAIGIVIGLGISSSAFAQTTIPTGGRCWWTFTGENGVDYLDLANWRWAGGGTAGQPSGGGYTGPYGYPTSLDVLLTNRHEIGATIWDPPSSSTPTATSVGRAVIDGSSASYIARDAAVGGVGIRQSWGGGIEIDGGVTLEIINNAKYAIVGGGLSGQTGANSNYTALSSNGYGTSPKQDYDAWVANNTATQGGNHKGNSLRSSMYVTSGGTFEMGSFSNITSGNVATTAGTLNFAGNAGLHAAGLATVRINGNYTIGTATGGGSKGGGHLTLQGYNAGSTIRIGTGANTLEMRPDTTTSTPSNYVVNWSSPPELRVILDATNNAGQFNTAVADTLRIWPQGAGNPVIFNVDVNGYTPVVGHVFPIITATALSDGTNTGVLGAMSKGWSTPFTSGAGTFQFLQTYSGQQGVFLEVTAVVPEPGAVGLLAAAGGVAGLCWFRRRR